MTPSEYDALATRIAKALDATGLLLVAQDAPSGEVAQARFREAVAVIAKAIGDLTVAAQVRDDF